jgi:hypothetical protein
MTLLYRRWGSRGKPSLHRSADGQRPGTGLSCADHETHPSDDAALLSAAASYIFSTGERADAIRMSSAELDGTVLAVRTVDQGTYYFVLDETKSASISGRLLVLRF